jgi:hypothetical protein
MVGRFNRTTACNQRPLRVNAASLECRYACRRRSIRPLLRQLRHVCVNSIPQAQSRLQVCVFRRQTHATRQTAYRPIGSTGLVLRTDETSPLALDCGRLDSASPVAGGLDDGWALGAVDVFRAGRVESGGLARLNPKGRLCARPEPRHRSAGWTSTSSLFLAPNASSGGAAYS